MRYIIYLILLVIAWKVFALMALEHPFAVALVIVIVILYARWFYRLITKR